MIFLYESSVLRPQCTSLPGQKMCHLFPLSKEVEQKYSFHPNSVNGNFKFSIDSQMIAKGKIMFT